MKPRNGKRSKKEWSEIFELSKSSGVSIEKFCKDKGISLTSYYKNRNKQNLNNEVKFVEISPKKVSSRKLLLEIKFSNWELIFSFGGC